MSLRRLLAWIGTKRRGSTQPQYEPGVMISTRLKELHQVESPKPVETATLEPHSEDDENQTNRDRFGT